MFEIWAFFVAEESKIALGPIAYPTHYETREECEHSKDFGDGQATIENVARSFQRQVTEMHHLQAIHIESGCRPVKKPEPLA